MGKHYVEIPKWNVSIKFFPLTLELRKPHGKGGGENVRRDEEDQENKVL